MNSLITFFLLIANKDRDISYGNAPVLRHPLRKLGEEEQVNVCGEEKDIKVGEMKENQSSLHCLYHRGPHATFWTAFS